MQLTPAPDLQCSDPGLLGASFERCRSAVGHPSAMSGQAFLKSCRRNRDLAIANDFIKNHGWWHILSETAPERIARIEEVLGNVQRVELTRKYEERYNMSWSQRYCTIEARMTGYTFWLKYGWFHDRRPDAWR